MLQALRSNLRRTIITTLVFGALTVVGLAAFPQQSAQATATPHIEEVVQQVAMAGGPVKCKGKSTSPLNCGRKIHPGDEVSASISVANFKKPCTFKFVAVEGQTSNGTAGGKVTKAASNAACEFLRVKKGDPYGFTYFVGKTPKQLPTR